ncbi:MAG: YicC family protein [Ignavibacteriaceae bacterium]|nr:YicC family protein [Ignavibacteriaceae bacterium]
MIMSMTGFGKGSAGNSRLSAEVEVKSVNSRYLDISLKLSSALSNKEYEIRELIKSKVKRGKLAVIVQIKSSGLVEGETAIDKERLINFVSLLKEIKKTAKLTDKIKLEHLIPNRDLFLAENTSFTEKEFEFVKKALSDSLDQLIIMKKNEGKELAKDLRKRIEIITNKIEAVQKESIASVSEYFEKLKTKMKLLIQDITPYNDRLELELAVIAERAEITEECVRLKSHMKFFLDSIDTDEEPGRKMNFLCQEMNREANTISSKSISTDITHNVVQVKEEIEKIREQIQNIE